MVNALATGRGRFKDPVRYLIRSKLGFIKPALTPEDVNHNLELFARIHPNAFHCAVSNTIPLLDVSLSHSNVSQEYSPPRGHYESDLLTQAIADTMFSGPNAIGVEHRELFNPMPLTTVAFVLALVSWEFFSNT